MDTHGEKPKAAMPMWQRIVLRILGVTLLLLAVGTYVKGLVDFKPGELEVGYNYKGIEMIRSRTCRIAFLLGVAGVACFWGSFARQDKTNDKDSS